jgi:RNA polymerase sigma factor (sigma-70 family)
MDRQRERLPGAGVAKLADARDLGSRGRKAVQVQVLSPAFMIDATRTTSALLASLRDPANDAAWVEIDKRYRPIVTNLARRAGLNDADAADVAQETMSAFFRAYQAGRYDRDRGRLRAWLIGIAKNSIADAHRARAKGPGRLETALSPDMDDQPWAAAWEAERRAEVLRLALAELRASDRLDPKNLSAFEMAAIQNVPVPQVAASLGMSAQEVYLAKSRCLERMRTIIERVQAAFDDQ